MIHEFIHEKIGAYAIGALDRDEVPDVEAHLRECAECAQALAGYRRLPPALNLAVPDAPLPDGFSERLVRRATERQRPVAMPIPFRRPPVRDGLHRYWQRLGDARLPWGLAAACLLVALLATGRISELNADLSEHRSYRAQITEVMASPGLRTRAVEPVNSQVQGNLFVSKTRDSAVLMCTGLPPPEEGRVYQVWLTGGGKVASAGTFKTWSSGTYDFLVHPSEGLAPYNRLRVTVEPEGGSSAPSGRDVMRARF